MSHPPLRREPRSRGEPLPYTAHTCTVTHTRTCMPLCAHIATRAYFHACAHAHTCYGSPPLPAGCMKAPATLLLFLGMTSAEEACGGCGGLRWRQNPRGCGRDPGPSPSQNSLGCNFTGSREALRTFLGTLMLAERSRRGGGSFPARLQMGCCHSGRAFQQSLLQCCLSALLRGPVRRVQAPLQAEDSGRRW